MPVNFLDRHDQPHWWPGLLAWCLAWVAMVLLDGHIPMPNLALLLVLGSAVAGLWLGIWLSIVINIASVAFFSFFFVDPRLDFWPSVWEDLLLVLTTLAVSTLVTTLTARLRRAFLNETLHAERVTQLRRLSEAVRDSDDLVSGLQKLLQQLVEVTQTPAYAVLLIAPSATTRSEATYQFFGTPDKRMRKQLLRTLNASETVPVGSGHAGRSSVLGTHPLEPLCAVVRAKSITLGAVLLPTRVGTLQQALGLPHLQALCDLLGAEFERTEAVRRASEALDKANSHLLRNTLLTAISHDYRTPLATIIGAASALNEPSLRYSPEKIGLFVTAILTEAEHLNRMTTNTLQLARLGREDIQLNLNWESLEELSGVAVTRLTASFPAARIELSFPSQLPPLYCDAILILQALDNLLLNSLKHSPEGELIQLMAQSDDDEITLSVTDQGPGIPEAWREKVFDAFQRIQLPGQSADSGEITLERRGVGLGLAVCRAIAHAHGARIHIDPSQSRGVRICMTFPLRLPPDIPVPASEELA